MLTRILWHQVLGMLSKFLVLGHRQVPLVLVLILRYSERYYVVVDIKIKASTYY